MLGLPSSDVGQSHPLNELVVSPKIHVVVSSCHSNRGYQPLALLEHLDGVDAFFDVHGAQG